MAHPTLERRRINVRGLLEFSRQLINGFQGNFWHFFMLHSLVRYVTLHPSGVLCSIEREVNHMAKFEERLAALEQEQAKLKQDNTELKQKVELQTIALGGLVNKTMLERINEKNDKIFQSLIAHDKFTNQQLSEFREKVEVQIEGKIAGMQAEMRQGFEQQGQQIATLRDEMDSRFDAVNSRLDQMDSRFDAVNSRLNTIDSRFDAVNSRLNTIDSRFDAMDSRLNTIDSRFDAVNSRLDQITHLLSSPDK